MAQSAPASRTKRSPRGTKPASADASGPLPTLRILETRVLRGPNYWAREPVIRLLVDLGMKTTQDALVPQAFDALVGRRRRQLHGCGHFLVAHPAILLQQRENGEIRSVEIVSHGQIPDIIR